jgi:B3 DNA binding domain
MYKIILSSNVSSLWFIFIIFGVAMVQHIPKNFYKHLPVGLPRRAALVIQRGKFWKVDVCQNEEGICFSRGWPEFAKAHDLRMGYFLVFQYEGSMVFNVKVFDTTCCLKDYSSIHCEHPTFKFESPKFIDLTSDVKSEGKLLDLLLFFYEHIQ